MARHVSFAPAAVILVLAVSLTGCYVQRPLPHQPEYRPASWEPVMGMVLPGGEEIMFDEPATLETGRIVYRLDGRREAIMLQDIHRLLVGHKTLDKPRTFVFGTVLIAAFTAFFLSIG